MPLVRAAPEPGRTQFALGLALFVSGLGLEIGLMAHRALWLRGLGPICGVHPASLHCPGCYAATALALLGAFVAATAVRDLKAVRV
jgi:hypothetical protein